MPCLPACVNLGRAWSCCRAAPCCNRQAGTSYIDCRPALHLHSPPPSPLPAPPAVLQVLVEKCLGRRLCRKCGKNYNIADIYLPASEGRPEIVMPPLSPPADCLQHMEQRADDTEPVIRRRLEVYKAAAQPVEDYYSSRGQLLNFEITGGIPQTLPRLLELLKPRMEVAPAASQRAADAAAAGQAA